MLLQDSDVVHFGHFGVILFCNLFCQYLHRSFILGCTHVMKGSSVMDVDAKNEFSFPFRAVCLQILFLYLDHVVPAGP